MIISTVHDYSVLQYGERIIYSSVYVTCRFSNVINVDTVDVMYRCPKRDSMVLVQYRNIYRIKVLNKALHITYSFLKITTVCKTS